jgi:4-hydroxy-2,2'-bipyrrole-5-carbaldehyde O-methyltransferase
MSLDRLFAALTFLRRPGALKLMGDATTAVRQNFLFAAARCGLLEALRTPRTTEELVTLLRVQRLDLLDALLDLGVSVGELRVRHSKYLVAGARSRALVAPGGEGLAGLVEALHTYYNSVYRELPGRLHGEPNGNYLEHIGGLVAQVSRMSEPFMKGFVERAVAGTGPRRVLELGCGSGAHLRTAAMANPGLSGVGLELDPAVVAQAQANLDRWGLGARFQVLQGDLRLLPAGLGRFDVITLHNVIYYFSPEKRPELLASLRPALTAGGTLVLVTSAQSRGTDAMAANLDVATRSIVGCWPLPDLDELRRQLSEAGFASTSVTRLMPGAAYYGLTGRG